MSSQSSSEDDEQSPKQAKKGTCIVKKPHFLRRARTLPYDLRLLKQSQDNRREEIERRKRDEIDMHLSIIEMELSELDEILDEDVEKAIKRKIEQEFGRYRGSKFKEKLPSALPVGIHAELDGPLSAAQGMLNLSNARGGNVLGSMPPTTACQQRNDQTPIAITNPPSTSAVSASTQSERQHSAVSTVAETKETLVDVAIVEEEEDDEVTIIEVIDRTKLKRQTAYQRHRAMLESRNNRVSYIKEELSNKRPTVKASTSSWRIQNFKTLLRYINEIEDLLHKSNTGRDKEDFYEQLEARVSITKDMEIYGFEQFNYLDGKNILILRQADKELANFQYEFWRKNMHPEK